jgi:hypothetical protein
VQMPNANQIDDSSVKTLSRALAAAAKADWSFATKILNHLIDHPGDARNLGNNPEEYLRQKGFEIPDGYHLHYVDAEGHSYPPEAKDPDDAIAIRAMMKFSAGGHTLATCYFCPSLCLG